MEGKVVFGFMGFEAMAKKIAQRQLHDPVGTTESGYFYLWKEVGCWDMALRKEKSKRTLHSCPLNISYNTPIYFYSSSEIER